VRLGFTVERRAIAESEEIRDVRPGLWTAPRGAQCGGRTGRCPRFLAERRPSAEPALGASKVARPGKRRRSWPKNHRPAARRTPWTHHPKPMGRWRARGQCPTPTKVTPSETTCLGLFRALRCTIAVIF